MTRHRFNIFKNIWEEIYQKYFGDNLQNLISITESIAPYEYYKRTVGNTSNMVSIDIGGGTSDMVIVVGEEIKHITSFRFAANSIFGDGYASNNVNGIVRKFQSNIETLLDKAGLQELKNIGNEISNEKLSSDIASFFFSLKNNITGRRPVLEDE
jgi:actin-like ATPase involved in cell morphogenesis